jgi:multicomponent Na+:H+ antiporter subunit E
VGGGGWGGGDPTGGYVATWRGHQATPPPTPPPQGEGEKLTKHTMSGPTANISLLPAAFARGIGFLVLWLVLAGFNPGDLPAAVVAVAGATWTSLRLLPPGGPRLSPRGIARLALRFPLQSLTAGIDVARRAFDPRLPLRPGFVTVSPRIPPGTPRDAFCAFASLLPGTLPVDTNDDGTLLVHCLDVGQPVAAQMAADEELFARALGGWPDNG